MSEQNLLHITPIASAFAAPTHPPRMANDNEQPAGAVRDWGRFRDWGVLEYWYRRCVPAACEALYPPHDGEAPDFIETDLPQRVASYVDTLPPPQRRLLKLMFIGVEAISLLLAPFRRFSRRARTVRERAVRRWRASSVLPLRLIGDALKSSLHMVYLSHPTVMRHMGEYKVWSHPDHTYDMDVRGSADAEGS